jgi:hypothetical protein
VARPDLLASSEIGEVPLLIPGFLAGGVRPARKDYPMLLEVLGSSGREVRDVLRAATPTHRRLRDYLLTIAVATVGIDLLCAILGFLLERHASETDIKTFGSAAFWTTTQLLTVSSQVKNPISAGGRLLDVFMEIYAITVIATLAGAIGSFLQKRGQEMDEKH